MRHRLFPYALLLLAILCITLVLGGILHVENIFATLTVPFSLIGNGLRHLSLSSPAGDVAAWCIYALICLAPFLPLLLHFRRGEQHIEDVLLVLLSAVLFYALYRFINPALIADRFGKLESVGHMALSGTAWSILLAYAVLCLLRSCRDRRDRLFLLLRVVLGAIAVVLTVSVFAVSFAALRSDMAALLEANTALSDSDLSIGQIFLALQAVVSALPRLIGICIILCGMHLVAALQASPYSGETLDTAKRFSSLCRASVAAVLVMQIILNVLQMLFGNAVLSANYTLELPLGAIALLLASMALAELIAQGKLLKDDGDSII